MARSGHSQAAFAFCFIFNYNNGNLLTEKGKMENRNCPYSMKPLYKATIRSNISKGYF